MTPDIPAAKPHRPDLLDFREVLSAVFGLMGPDVGQIEWLLDRIEGTPERRT